MDLIALRHRLRHFLFLHASVGGLRIALYFNFVQAAASLTAIGAPRRELLHLVVAIDGHVEVALAPAALADLAIAHGDARYARLLRSLARVTLLILDDWGPEALTPNQARDLLEIVEDRYDKGSLIITSNQSLGAWGEVFGDAVIASAILDRLLHHSITINIKGESFRLKEKLRAGLLKPKLDSAPPALSPDSG